MRLKKLTALAFLVLSLFAIFSFTSVSASALTKPATPTNVDVVEGYKSAVLSWNPSRYATGYKVVKYNYDEGKYEVVAYTAKTQITVNLDYLEICGFKIQAYNKSGSSIVYSGYSSLCKFATVPNKVSTVKSSQTKMDGVTLSWPEVTGASGYQVFYTKGATDKTYSFLTATAKTSIDLNLASGTDYTFKVRAYFKVQTGLYSYGSFSNSIVKVATTPSQVSGVEVYNGTVTWNAAKFATGYQVWVKEPGSSYKRVEITRDTSAKVNASKSAYISVIAYNITSGKVTYGSFSSAAKDIGMVTGLKATPGYKSATLSWNKLSGAYGYGVFAYNSSTKKYEPLKATFATTVTVPLSYVTEYKLIVKPFIKIGSSNCWGHDSAVVTVATNPMAATGVKVSDIELESAKISWNKVSGATGYVVFYRKNSTGAFIKSVVTAATSATIKLTANTNFEVVVRAYTKSPSGLYSYATYATSNVKFKTALSKVDGIKLISAVDETATRKISCSAVDSAHGYQVWAAKEGSAVYSFVGYSTSTTFTGAFPQNTYASIKARAYYRLASGQLIYGAFSNSIKVQVGMNPVKGFKVNTAATTGRTVALAWDESSNVSGYRVYIKKDGDWVGTNVSNSRTSFSYTGLVGDTSYDFAIRSYYIDSDKKVTFSDAIYITGKTNRVTTTKLTVPEEVTAYVEQSFRFTPQFTPSDTYDKTFTVTAKDYTFKYGGYKIFGVWYDQKTATLKWKDYFTINSDGSIMAKQKTVTPEKINGDEVDQVPFAFDVTIIANDSKVTTTTKLSIDTVAMRIKYDVSQPWEYGEQLNLYYNIYKYKPESDGPGDKSYHSSEIKWKSSNTSIATIDGNGKVTFKGTGEVTFTVYTSDGMYSASVKNYVAPKIKFESVYFENCVVGKSYQIKTSVLPAGAKATVSYTPTHKESATVTSNGLVKFLKEGTVTIAVTSSEDSTIRYVVFTSGEYAVPTGDKAELYKIAFDYANEIKYYEPAFERVDHSEFSSINIDSPPNDFEVESIFKTFEPAISKFVSTGEEDYQNKLPVAGQSLLIIPESNMNFIKSVDVIENGYTYDMKITLVDETMQNLQTNAQLISTSHGKIFDLLSKDYMDVMVAQFKKQDTELTYKSFVQKYHDSSITLTINRVSDKVENIEYNLVGDMKIESAKMKFKFFTMFDTNIDFTVNNIIKIKVFDYQK